MSVAVPGLGSRRASAATPLGCDPKACATGRVCGIKLLQGCTLACCTAKFPNCFKWTGVDHWPPGGVAGLCSAHAAIPSAGEPARVVCCCPPGTRKGNLPKEPPCVAKNRCTQEADGDPCGNTCCDNDEYCANEKLSLCCKNGESRCPGNKEMICCPPGKKCCAHAPIGQPEKLDCCDPTVQDCVKGECKCKPGTTPCGEDCCKPRELCYRPSGRSTQSRSSRRTLGPKSCCPFPRVFGKNCCPSGTIATPTGCCPPTDLHCCKKCPPAAPGKPQKVCVDGACIEL